MSALIHPVNSTGCITILQALFALIRHKVNTPWCPLHALIGMGPVGMIDKD